LRVPGDDRLRALDVLRLTQPVGIMDLRLANRFFAASKLIEPDTARYGGAVCLERNPNEFFS